MENIAELNLQYPIGPFVREEQYTAEQLSRLIEIIENAPAKYKDLVKNLGHGDLKKTYRPGSWNVKQLVHHVADIQLLHFFRMKKALTEPDYKDVTLINMDAWVLTADSIKEPIEDSLVMLEGITRRYVFLIKSLKEEDFQVQYFHPVRKYTIDQAQAVAMSAWHVEHHLAHIKLAIQG